MDRICFERPNFYMYFFILSSLIIYLVYYFHSSLNNYHKDSIKNTNSLLENLNRQIKYNEDQKYEQNYEQKYQQKHEQKYEQNHEQKYERDNQERIFLDKIYNPLSGTSTTYAGGSLNNKGYDAYNIYQNLGFISDNINQYPIYGRYHDPNRTDRMEYYTINEGRNKIKIPIKTKNFSELYTEDIVNIPEFGGNFTFTKYEDTDENRYNPNKF